MPYFLMELQKEIQGWQVRGDLTRSRKKNDFFFAWGLGHKMNNEAKWMALLQGLELLDMTTTSRITVFGDSRQVIYKMINGYSLGSIKCRRLYDRITPLLSNKIDFFHILRANNAPADALANSRASLPQSHICFNGLDIGLKPIP